LGLHPRDISGVKDLTKLPLLSKANVRAAGAELLSEVIPRREMLRSTTSGSTGFPMTVYRTRETEEREYGFLWARRRPGLHRGESYGSFTGLQLVSSATLRPPFWRHNFAANQTCYSIFHLTPDTIPLYLAEMARRRHTYLQGYPSVVAILAKYILDRGLDWIHPPRFVFSEAEELLDVHRRWIEEGFKTRVYNTYSVDEKCGAMTEYECGHLHYDMDYGVIEYLPRGRDERGTTAELVCTAFDNPAFPLIRYRIGDLVLLPDAPISCPAHAGPIVLAVSGRTGHALVTRDGRQIQNISVIVKRCRNVEMVQAIQETRGIVEVRVLRSPGYTREDEENLLFQFQQKIGDVDFKVVYVSNPDEMERTDRGKFLSIVSKLRDRGAK